jgi:Zn-dependent peptidase ImmA (M78 family)
MHQYNPDKEMEEQANSFASEFLMPEKDIRPYLVNISLDKLASLKPFWKVSMAALLNAAKDLGQINSRQSSILWAELSRAGYRMREPASLDLPEEKPTLLKKILHVYGEQMNYSSAELSKLLLLDHKEMQDYYFDKQEEVESALEEVDFILKLNK